MNYICKNLVACLLLLCLLTACTKEGSQGPAGATGTTGPQGPAGTANVIYSKWINEKTPWTDTAMTSVGSGGVRVRANSVNTPAVTQDILDKGLVLGFAKFAAVDPPNPLPWKFNTSSTSFIEVNLKITLGKVVFYFYNPNSVSNSTPVTFTALNGGSAQYRYVIIPGGVLSGRSATGSEKEIRIKGKIHTESELKAMSYSQICSLLNIEQ